MLHVASCEGQSYHALHAGLDQVQVEAGTLP